MRMFYHAKVKTVDFDTIELSGVCYASHSMKIEEDIHKDIINKVSEVYADEVANPQRDIVLINVRTLSE